MLFVLRASHVAKRSVYFCRAHVILFLFCEHCVESVLWKRARLLSYLCQLELLAGVVYRFLFKAFEEHVLEFIESLGIFFTISLATLFGFSLQDAASVGIIGAADGPTSIFVANYYHSNYLGAIIVAAYSYMALVPIIQPPAIRLVTTKKERRIHMDYNPRSVSKTAKILFPICITVVAGIIAPSSVALVGFLMFGNLIRECGVLNSLSDTAQGTLANLITLMLGITVASQMRAEDFLNIRTIFILLLGLVAFIFDTIGGVLFAKFMNLFRKNKINPMIGACGISAFPMSARVITKMALEEDPTNVLIMQATGVNVSGQVASVIAGGIILSLVPLV